MMTEGDDESWTFGGGDGSSNGGPPRDDYEEVEREALQEPHRGADRESRKLVGGGGAAGPLFEEQPMSAVRHANLAELEDLREQKQGPIDAVPTPLPSLNSMLQMAGGGVGMAHGWHGIIGGKSSIGKTQTALNFAVHAMRHGERVLYLQLEGSREEILSRAGAIASRQHLKYVTRGQEYDPDRNREADEALDALPGELFYLHEPVYDVGDLEEITLHFWDELDVRTVFVDHFQIAKSGNDRQLYDRITEISNRIRSMAVTMRIATWGLSQLTRGAAREYDDCPRKEDLRGAGTLEENADLVLVLDHCDEHLEHDRAAERLDTRLLVDKNRHGPTGNMPVRFDFSESRMYELDRRRDSELRPEEEAAPPDELELFPA